MPRALPEVCDLCDGTGKELPDCEGCEGKGRIRVDDGWEDCPECLNQPCPTCAVPVECEHGYDVCPICDPCTCKQAAVATVLPEPKASTS